jgi:hypothetical protein
MAASHEAVLVAIGESMSIALVEWDVGWGVASIGWEAGHHGHCGDYWVVAPVAR